MHRTSISNCFVKKVIPVVWDPTRHVELLATASAIFLQGGSLVELREILDRFQDQRLQHVSLFVHVDLVAGLENNEAGLEYLASFDRLTGVVSVHHHLASAARKLGLLSIVRLFLSDSRAVDRALAVAAKSRPDAIEILPAAVAPKVVFDFRDCAIPRITGGLCRTADDLQEALHSGCRAVTSTRPEMWRLNEA